MVDALEDKLIEESVVGDFFFKIDGVLIGGWL